MRNQRKNKSMVRIIPIGMLMAMLLISCDDLAVNGDENRPVQSVINEDKVHLSVDGLSRFSVKSGESIQLVLDLAGPNSVIHIEPGVYSEGLTVNHPNVRITGRKGPNDEKVIIENPGGVNHGINVRPGANRFSLSHVEVRGFDRNGVFLIDVDGFDIRHVIAADNREYGIYPVRSVNGSVSHSVASGHADAGFYVGQANDIKLTHNSAFSNVIGIEVSNSDDILVSHNKTYNNSAGILAALLPGRMIKETNRIVLRQNEVWDNNLPNFAEEGLATGVPSGSGILAIGIDHSVIENNTVKGNDFLGIALASSLVLGQLAGLPEELFSDIEPYPDYVRIVKNNVTENGLNPPDLPFPGVDLLWDGSGLENCWGKNRFESSAPLHLPDCN